MIFLVSYDFCGPNIHLTGFLLFCVSMDHGRNSESLEGFE